MKHRKTAHDEPLKELVASAITKVDDSDGQDTIAPTRPVKVTANTFSPGTAAPTAGPAAVVAAMTTR